MLVENKVKNDLHGSRMIQKKCLKTKVESVQFLVLI